MGEIVSLIDAPIADEQKTYPEIVAELERLLDKAKKGEIAAVALAWVTPGGRPFTNWIAGHGFSSCVHSASMAIVFRQTQSMCGNLDPYEASDDEPA